MKGNALPEVLVALSITSFCGGLAVMIFLNVLQGTRPFIIIKSSEIAVKYMKDAIKNADFSENTYRLDNCIIVKKSIVSPVYSGCLEIKIKVYDLTNKKLNEVVAIVENK